MATYELSWSLGGLNTILRCFNVYSCTTNTSYDKTFVSKINSYFYVQTSSSHDERTSEKTSPTIFLINKHICHYLLTHVGWVCRQNRFTHTLSSGHVKFRHSFLSGSQNPPWVKHQPFPHTHAPENMSSICKMHLIHINTYLLSIFKQSIKCIYTVW